MFGDIAMPTGLQNADPCTERGCLWPKSTDGNVYVPFRISRQYCKSQQPVCFWRQHFYFGSLFVNITHKVLIIQYHMHALHIFLALVVLVEVYSSL